MHIGTYALEGILSVSLAIALSLLLNVDCDGCRAHLGFSLSSCSLIVTVHCDGCISPNLGLTMSFTIDIFT